MVAGTGFDARRVDPRIRLAMRVLEFEQARVPDVHDIASRVGLSAFHFSRLFAAQVGESCAAYSRRIRLDNANNQMMHDPVPLGVVAATFGYANQAAFTRAFARQFGMAPTQYLSRVLGLTPTDHAASHIVPIDPSLPTSDLLTGRVCLMTRCSAPALVRRFYGHDLAGHWRRFLAELPDGLIDGGRFAGMGYDNARVTPPEHWRYDCAIVFDRRQPLPILDGDIGLDGVEVPGGLHAEVSFEGSFADLLRTSVGLFTEWLPRNRDYRPEGDPVVHWLDGCPTAAKFAATATIRIKARDDTPAYNMLPLTRHGRAAGHRSGSSDDPS